MTLSSSPPSSPAPSLTLSLFQDRTTPDTPISPTDLQIDVEDLEEGPVVNGERPDCLLVSTPVVSGSKRRAQSSSTEPTNDGGTSGKAAAIEQVGPYRSLVVHPSPLYFAAFPWSLTLAWSPPDMVKDVHLQGPCPWFWVSNPLHSVA